MNRQFGHLLMIVLSGSGLLAVAGCGGSGTTSPSPNKQQAMQLRESVGEAADGGTAAATTGGTGWGNMLGSFVYDGAPPDLQPLSTGGKDPSACNPNGIENQALVVDESTKGIKNIILFARRTSRTHESYEEAKNEPIVFDQKGCLFLSHVLTMQASQPLEIHNSDPVGHNTNISPPGVAGTNPLLQPGATAEFNMGRQQSTPVPVSCNVHPWMKAYILPRNDPYAIVTDEQGHFELANLPAGEEIEFQLWHESAGGKNGALVINGLTDSEGRFKKTVPADGQVDLGTVKVPSTAFNL